MPSYFAPPMPFHPEELYGHLKQLEQVFAGLSLSNTNARVAMAKAMISATASFVEGCLDCLAAFTLSDLQVPQPARDQILERLRGLQDKTELLKKRLAGLRSGWQVQDGPASQFVEGRIPSGRPGLRQLRNLVDHGDVVEQADLRLENIGEFRGYARSYLEAVYASLGVETPGWLTP